MKTEDKEGSVRKTIRDRGSILVAFSGGVDSGVLAFLAREELGKMSRCVLLDSPMIPRKSIHEANEIADRLGLSLEIISAPYLESAEFRNNPKDRCYHCKKISARILKKRAHELGLAWIADGTNASDTGEYRPGIRAGNEEGIIHPFVEAGITKDDIRAIARRHNLPFWDKPSAACLSSRIPYGETITRENLAMTEAAEEYLNSLDIRQVRVRNHATMARIEVDNDGMATVFTRKDEVVSALKAIGFTYVTLDLAGYRSGSMDEPVKNDPKEG